MPYYGPLNLRQNQAGLGQQQRRANHLNALRAARAAHAYAQQNNLYGRAAAHINRVIRGYMGRQEAGAQRTYNSVRKTYSHKAAMDKWGTPMMRNTVRPLRSKFPSNTRRVKYMGKGKKRKAMVKIPKVLTTHPHTIRQTVYLAKNSLDATTKSITALNPFELYPSTNQNYLTACVFTLTKTWWGTTKVDGTNKARIGNQVVPPIYSDLYLTGATNSAGSLNKRPTMLTLNNIPEQPNGIIPNNHYVSGFNIQLDIQSLVPGAQMVCVQVVRRSFQQDPVANGVISTADFQEMTNDIRVVDKDKFQTIYQKLIHIPALTPGKPQKHYKVKKFIKCNLKRNTLRKTSSISSFSALVGAQVKPHYEFSTNGEMYNQCFLIIKARRYANTANVTSRKTGTGATPGLSNLPDKWDEMTPAKCALTGNDVSGTINFGGFTEPQINTTLESGIYSGACIKIRGTASTYFRVREILNQDVDNTADATPVEDWPEENLENINTIEEYVSDDECCHDEEHIHPIPLDQEIDFDDENGPHIDTAGPEPVNSETDEEPEFIPNPKHNKKNT